MPEAQWDIRREGRAWKGTEAQSRYNMLPEKTAMFGGKLYWEDEEPLTVLALSLENVGMDAAVRLSDPQLWRAAVAALENRTDSEDG